MFNYIMSDKKCDYKTEILLLYYWLSGKAGRKKYLAQGHGLHGVDCLTLIS